MASIDPNASLGELVAAQPARAALFERLGFDYCCGGGQSLADAATARGLDPDALAAVVAAVDDISSAGEAERDWRQASVGELCDHIVEVHHGALRRELPRIDDLLATVVRVHGAGRRELHEIRRLFDTLRAELDSHLETEERELFPAARALEGGDAAPVAAALIAQHEAEHGEVGDLLARLRALTGGYDRERAGCGTHRALLDSLEWLEHDLHQHVHEENNVLFPRVRELGAKAVEEGPARV